MRGVYQYGDRSGLATELDNFCRWDGASAGHYEVWYLTMSDETSAAGYWIRYSITTPDRGRGEPYAQLWFARFDRRNPAQSFAINRKLPIQTFASESRPFAVRIGDAELTHAGCRGQLHGSGHEVRWALKWRPGGRTYRPLPVVMYRGSGLGDTAMLTPNLDVPVRGSITIDGSEHAIAGAPGVQTHLWGRKHAHWWAWGHCNAFAGRRGAVLETLTLGLERFGRVLPPLTLFTLFVDGEVLRFNQLADAVTTSGDCGTGYYRFSGGHRRIRVEGEFTCAPAQMVQAVYVDPDGQRAWCANTEIGDLRVTVWKRDGLGASWREHDRLLAPGTAHFEIAGRTRNPAVVTPHVTV
jgi:hypothetical protein